MKSPRSSRTIAFLDISIIFRRYFLTILLSARVASVFLYFTLLSYFNFWLILYIMPLLFVNILLSARQFTMRNHVLITIVYY